MKIKELIENLNKITDEQTSQLENLVKSHKQVIIMGNGGSNAIASHISQDYTKKLKVKSFSFSDASRLTCYINDYGMENAYVQFLKEFADKETLVILISSSGNSKNIVNSLEHCYNSNIPFILLTGFDSANESRKNYKDKAKLEIWIDSKDYGVVECAHEVFLHSIA
jgi:D-sedoheptulose 7-phosphate isomerase